MKVIIIPLAGAIFIWGLMILIEHTYYKTISSKTEEKYLRNIVFYRTTDNDGISDEVFLAPPINGRDSLSYIHKNCFFFVDPFSKYHISDVGSIPRSSRLSKVIDSMRNNFKTAPNKFE